MTKIITLELRTEDAEPILRDAAFRAAKYGALVDHVTKRTYNAPNRGAYQSFDDAKANWNALFLKGKRMVEAFGLEYEQTSEAETMTVYYPLVGGKRKVVSMGPLGKVGMITGSVPDYKHPQPAYYGGVHEEACRQAAERVVRAWKEKVGAKIAA